MLRIDGPVRYAALENFANLRHGFQRLMLGCLRREPADVRRGDHLRMAGERGRWHLIAGTPNIHCAAANAPIVQCAQQRRFIHQITARGIDERRSVR